jgi:hypothetical protein
VARDPLDRALDALLAAPAGDAGAKRAAVEAVLTAGYARALELEAEQLALEQKLKTAVLLSPGGPASHSTRRLRSVVSAVTERVALLRRRLDEANRRHGGSRQEHLDGGPVAERGADQQLSS